MSAGSVLAARLLDGDQRDFRGVVMSKRDEQESEAAMAIGLFDAAVLLC